MILKSTKIKKKKKTGSCFKKKTKEQSQGRAGCSQLGRRCAEVGLGGKLHKGSRGISAGLPCRRLLGGAHVGEHRRRAQKCFMPARGGQLISSVLAKNKQTKTVLWGFKFFLLFWGFFVFVFLKEKYSEDTKQTLVRGHLLLTSQGDQMARSSVTLKSVTPLAAL